MPYTFCAPFPLFRSVPSHRRLVTASTLRACAGVTRRAALGTAAVYLLGNLAVDNATGLSAVTDRARLLPRGVEQRLATRLVELEEATGLRVRVQTVSDGTSTESAYPSGTYDALIVADTRSGNLLAARVEAPVYQRLPRSFWIELPNRYGTQFYVRENGPDAALVAAMDAVVECAQRKSMCRAVPGVSRDQLLVSVVSAALAGAIAGAASRTDGKQLNTPFLLLFSPIWSIFLISFGLGPVLTRLDGFTHMEPVLVASAFVLTAGAIWTWVPRGLGPPTDTTTRL